MSPQHAARPCAYRGCPRLVRGRDIRYCDEHKRQINAAYDAQRGTSAQRGYDARWRRLRQMYLNAYPLCADPYGCHAQHGELVPATEVDHIKSKCNDGTNDWNNLQALCKSCHSRKTAIKEKKWGRGG